MDKSFEMKVRIDDKIRKYLAAAAALSDDIADNPEI